MWKNQIVISSSSKKPYTLDYTLLCDTMMTTPVHRDNITTSDMTRWHWHHLNLNKLHKHHKKLTDWLNEWSQTEKMNGYLCRDHFLVIIQSMHVYLSILYNDNDKYTTQTCIIINTLRIITITFLTRFLGVIIIYFFVFVSCRAERWWMDKWLTPVNK